MAEGDETKPSASEKGKGKAPAEDRVDRADGHPSEPQKNKSSDAEDGKDSEKPAEGKHEQSQVAATFCLSTRIDQLILTEELSEEDLQLKGELDMLVERLQVRALLRVGPASSDLSSLRNRIRTCTSRPWKRLRILSRHLRLQSLQCRNLSNSFDPTTNS